MMETGILDLIRQAAEEGHDFKRIQSEMAAGMVALRNRLPRPAGLPPYLERRLAHPEHMDGSDAGRVLITLGIMAEGAADPTLKAEVVRLNLMAARLGGLEAMLALGPQVAEALRKKAPPTP